MKASVNVGVDRTVRRSIAQIAGGGLLAAAIAGTPLVLSAQEQHDSSTAARIARIEHDIVRLTRADVDTGPPQSIGERMAELGIPGVSVAVFDSGRIIWAKGYGVADISSHIPVDTATLFQAASISKPVAAAGMLRLVEQGRLALDADVNTMLTSWQVPSNQFTVTEKVTLRRIVSHTAGLTVHGFGGYLPDAPLPTLPQILDGIPPANSPPVRVDTFPGTRESYSGGGYEVMQLVMQDVTGRPFADLLAELVLRPAGMLQSSYLQPLPASMASRAASGYRSPLAPMLARFYVYPEQAAAGLWTTPSDLARFLLAIGRAWRGDSGEVLQPATAREMLTPAPNSTSGLGFGLSGSDSTFRYGHTGGNEGFRAYAVAFAHTGRGVVIMTNADWGAVLYREFANAVSREYRWPRMQPGGP